MLFILKVIAALILLAVVVIGIYILLQGKEEMFFEVWMLSAWGGGTGE